MKSEEVKFKKELDDIATALAMHIAAMKPKYQFKKEIPKEVRDKYMEEGGEKALWKMYGADVFMEQDLATHETDMKVKQYLKDMEAKAGKRVLIKDWLYFKIGG